MFNPFVSEDPSLDNAIAECFADLSGLEEHTEEYSAACDQLTKLYALKKSGPVDLNQLLDISAKIFIAFAVLKFERTDVVTTKLWSFFSKI